MAQLYLEICSKQTSDEQLHLAQNGQSELLPFERGVETERTRSAREEIKRVRVWADTKGRDSFVPIHVLAR